MIVLFIGDVTGPEGVARVVDGLTQLRARHDIDLVVANGENASITGPTPMGGSGMTDEAVDRLLHGGVDIVTSGCHGFDGDDDVLTHPRVLRPHNVGAGRPGRGVLTWTVGGEEIVLAALTCSDLILDHTPLWSAWCDLALDGTVLVHLVGPAHDVRVFAHAVDGDAAAVLGTLSHEATVHHRVLPGGTGLVPDVGMVGPLGGVGGFEADHFVAGLTGRDISVLPPYRMAGGPTIFDAVLMRLEGGKCLELIRVDTS